MNGRYRLDTNIIIGLFAGETAVRSSLETADEVFASSIALGELYFGARKSSRVVENLAQIDEFTFGCTILFCDTDTAREYGAIKAALRERGQPIPENDIWMAAIAQQHGLTLATRDSHFAAIEGLTTQVW